jgi:hypothetical protein
MRHLGSWKGFPSGRIVMSRKARNTLIVRAVVAAAVAILAGVHVVAASASLTAPAESAKSLLATPPTDLPALLQRLENAKSPDEQDRILGEILRYNADESLEDQANWEAWQAVAGIETHEGRLRGFEEQVRKQAALHASESNAFVLRSCDPPPDPGRTCTEEKARFQRRYWFALQGDYQAQRGVALCFNEEGTPSCTGVRRSRIMQCAWQLVMLSSGNPELEQSDVDDFKNCWEKLESADIERVRAKAAAIFARIYHRPLPATLF